MRRVVAITLLVASGVSVLAAVGSSPDAMPGPKADDAKLAGRKPPKASGTPKHPTASQGTREKVTVRWTKHVRLDNLAELEKYEALIRTPLGDCEEPPAMMSPGDSDTPARHPCSCAEYFGMDEGAYSPATTADMNWLMSCDLRCEPSRGPFLRRVPRAGQA